MWEAYGSAVHASAGVAEGRIGDLLTLAAMALVTIEAPPAYGAPMSVSPALRSLLSMRPLLLLGVLTLAGCSEPPTPPSAAPAGPAPESIATSTEVVCPSKDFATFLPAFANSDELRKTFTRVPLELVVRAHRAPADAPLADQEGMAMTTDVASSAHEVFAYRYDERLGRYEHVGTPLEPLSGAFIADPEWAFDFDVSMPSADEVRVSAGPEPERKTFVFTRSEECWTLTRVYDFGD